LICDIETSTAAAEGAGELAAWGAAGQRVSDGRIP